MPIGIDKKKEEAIARMEMWGIYSPIIKQFKDEGIVSESVDPFGACYWLDEDQMRRVKEFEWKNNALVYHVIHSYRNIGEMESYLFVSDYIEEWEYDRTDIKRGEQFSYVYNKSIPYYSEFDTIGIELTPAAGLKRIW